MTIRNLNDSIELCQNSFIFIFLTCGVIWTTFQERGKKPAYVKCMLWNLILRRCPFYIHISCLVNGFLFLKLYVQRDFEEFFFHWSFFLNLLCSDFIGTFFLSPRFQPEKFKLPWISKSKKSSKVSSDLCSGILSFGDLW